MKFIVFMMLFLGIYLQGNSQQSRVFKEKGIAIHGYDPVAFYTESKPVKGSPEINFHWEGATWLFASIANKELFMTRPEAYAPQYGGYCAYGTSEGHKAPTQIDTWTITNGKLYFNYNDKVKKTWLKDQQAHIMKADVNWPKIRDRE